MNYINYLWSGQAGASTQVVSTPVALQQKLDQFQSIKDHYASISFDDLDADLSPFPDVQLTKVQNKLKLLKEIISLVKAFDASPDDPAYQNYQNQQYELSETKEKLKYSKRRLVEKIKRQRHLAKLQKEGSKVARHRGRSYSSSGLKEVEKAARDYYLGQQGVPVEQLDFERLRSSEKEFVRQDLTSAVRSGRAQELLERYGNVDAEILNDPVAMRGLAHRFELKLASETEKRKRGRRSESSDGGEKSRIAGTHQASRSTSTHSKSRRDSKRRGSHSRREHSSTHVPHRKKSSGSSASAQRKKARAERRKRHGPQTVSFNVSGDRRHSYADSVRPLLALSEKGGSVTHTPSKSGSEVGAPSLRPSDAISNRGGRRRGCWGPCQAACQRPEGTPFWVC